MSFGEVVAFLCAGAAAGGINTIVGSGTLITFPVLLAFGYPPVTANVTNSIGLVPGSASGAIGYRRELRGQRGRVLRLGAMSLLGSLAGAVLLLVLPASAFKAIVPVFIAVALVLTLAQPRIGRAIARRNVDVDRHGARLVPAGVLVTGVYGGYFGAAQGVILMGFLGALLPQDLQRTNALKNVLAGIANGVAGLYFAFAAHVDWGAAALIAAGSIVGAQGGARVGRRLRPDALRWVIVAVGCFAIVRVVT
ncbi:MAG TPA: sulfite exporter TauE/SafE family protein [Solirubrobacteraceae bacterium]|jgi:hypothetical protein|nr:sulfite exporter TauE/SafE family protein [Solirubrobacteraceae bacterium]